VRVVHTVLVPERRQFVHASRLTAAKVDGGTIKQLTQAGDLVAPAPGEEQRSHGLISWPPSSVFRPGLLWRRRRRIQMYKSHHNHGLVRLCQDEAPGNRSDLPERVPHWRGLHCDMQGIRGGTADPSIGRREGQCVGHRSANCFMP
jgi:hypothetical protein